MKKREVYSFTEPRSAILRWLGNPGGDVSPEIRGILLGELFNAPMAVVAGVVNGLILNGFACFLAGDMVFLWLILADVTVAVVRVSVAYRGFSAARRHQRTPTDLVFITAALWCLVQGIIVMMTVRSNFPALQTASAITCVALLCTICSRNYAAPRYAIFLCVLVTVPFLSGVLMAENHLLRLIFFQATPFFVACIALLNRFKNLSIALMQARFESERSARYDSLTNLLNRAGLQEYLAALQLDDSRGFVVFYLDLDGFKAVNDTLGHAAGDRLLAEVAERLRQCTRSSDVLARLGGDEFVVIVPDMSEDQAPELASALIQRLSQKDYPQEGGKLARVGVSVGYACCPVDGTSLKELQLRADMALYEAKRAGKGVWRRSRQEAA